MTMLTDHVDLVIGIDTHKETHTAAFVDRFGAVHEVFEVEANAAGYQRLLDAASEHRGQRVWAVEGTGSYGAGLTTALIAVGEHVVEVERPGRPKHRPSGKSDPIDAVRAAREVLAREHQIKPRQRGNREAIRVLLATRNGAVLARTKALNHLHALVVTAPDELRARLSGTSTGDLTRRCAALRVRADMTDEHRATVMALRACARRAIACGQEVDELEPELLRLVRACVPELLDQAGVGPITAAVIYLAWSHRGRIRNDAAFAALAGVAPLEASSGQTVRHRLNRGGDRQLNRALHTIVLSRMMFDPETKTYVERRRAEGKTPREIRRCLKRHVARGVFKLLEHAT
jgi:transposase